MALSFTKMHGLGNDFVIIDTTRESFEPTATVLRHLADRREGIGCDQVLLIQQDGDGFGYRVFNADGGEVQQCGNGVRCIARWLFDHDRVEGSDFRLSSRAGPVGVQVTATGQVRVDMGVPEWEPERIPFQAEQRLDRYPISTEEHGLELGVVSMGNPHAVLEVHDVDRAEVDLLGPAVQALDVFPESVNVGFLQVVDADHIRLRVFERGVGETRACGTGACAAVAVGRVWNRLGPAVEVELPGGRLQIEWAGDEHPLWMTGPADYAFEGTIEP